jgi:hypothetical protein
MSEPRFPDVVVPLVGEDGNAFAIIGRVRSALRRGGATDVEIEEFTKEAMSGDYDNVLATAMRWVDVWGPEGICGEEDDGA